MTSELNKSSSKSLHGKVCLVTGATRGLGKGIALQLAEAGATVYITGRTLKPRASADDVTGSLHETAREMEQRGGHCIPVQVAHSIDSEVEKLFQRIKHEQNGRLDIVVNNAFAAVQTVAANVGRPFWEQNTSVWDEVNDVGLRNHYLCSVYAARMMVPRRQGLIINISSAAGLRYYYGVAYGVGKQALDRMAVDCAQELEEHNVAVVSLWPPAVKTEMMSKILTGEDSATADYAQQAETTRLFAECNSAEYTGKAVVALATDPRVMSQSGRVHLVADLGDSYRFVDIDGKPGVNWRCVKWLLEYNGYTRLAAWVPRCLKVPLWMMTLQGGKF